MFIDRSKFCGQFLKRVTQRTFLSKSDQWFQRRFFGNLFHVCILQKASIHQSNVYRWIKILQTSFEKGNPRNISGKLFQNLTSSFREDDCFLHVLIVQKAHIHQSRVYGRIKIRGKIFKGLPKEHSFEIISKSAKRFHTRRFFQNFFMTIQCKKPPVSRAMFMD